MDQTPGDVDRTAASSEAFTSARLTPGLVRPSLLEFVSPTTALPADEEKLLSSIISYISMYILAAEEVVFFITGDQPETLVAKATGGTRSRLLADKRFNFSGSLAASLVVEQTVVNITDISEEQWLDPKIEILDELVRLGVKSLLIANVADIGLLAAAATRPLAFSKIDEITLKSTAVQASVLLKMVIGRQRIEKTLAETNRLLALTKKIAPTLELSDLLRSTLQAVHTVVNGDTGSLMLLDEITQELRVKAAFGLPDDAATFSVKLGQGIAGWVAKNKKAIVIKDLPPGLRREGQADLFSSISVPLIAGDKLIGVVNIGSRNPEKTYDREDLDLVSRLLEQAAIAIQSSRSGRGIESLYFDTVKVLIKVIETKDPLARGHAANVTKYSLAIAAEMALPAQEIRSLEMAAMMHDVGYVGINNSVFRLNQPLSTVERVLINSHPTVASDVMKQNPKLRKVALLILHHHEKYDGTGYVSGLKGEEIPLGSRILAVADAFDAMISKRAYRDELSVEAAVNELRDNANSQFDPRVVDVFCRLIEKRPDLTTQPSPF